MTVRFAYIADDFTGATDVLEVLALAGAQVRLYLGTAPDDVACQLDAVGIATTARATARDAISNLLGPLFDRLLSLEPLVVQYKICSTFDSSPEIGNIAAALTVGWQRFRHQRTVPVIVGAPRLGRWVVFGHLFARAGTDGRIYRLDRHPVMSVHPVTPMEESDLGCILQNQGLSASVTYLSVLDLDMHKQELLCRIDDDGPQVVIADTLTDAHLEILGEMVLSGGAPPRFVVGSSGATQAVCYALTHHGLFSGKPLLGRLKASEPILVVSGSCSSVSARQLKYAVTHGFFDLPILPTQLLNNEKYFSDIVIDIARALSHGVSVIAHTCAGPDDPRVVEQFTVSDSLTFGRVLGTRLGQLITQVGSYFPLKRVIVTGGDTSGYVALTSGIFALDPIAVLAPGAPLCRAVAQRPELNGVEFCFKGGQTGPEDFYLRARNGED